MLKRRYMVLTLPEAMGARGRPTLCEAKSVGTTCTYCWGSGGYHIPLFAFCFFYGSEATLAASAAFCRRKALPTRGYLIIGDPIKNLFF